MKTLLLLKTSLFSTDGQSSRLATEFAERWRAQNPGAVVITRDLALGDLSRNAGLTTAASAIDRLVASHMLPLAA